MNQTPTQELIHDKKPERLYFIDLMECIAMFCVIIYHAQTYNVSFINDNSFVSYIRYFIQGLFPTSVPVFFFANGYLLFSRRLDMKKHTVKIINLIVLTVIWGMLNLLLMMPAEHQILSLKEFFKYLVDMQHGWIDPLWYMGALVCIYLFFPLLKNAYDNSKKTLLYFTVAIAFISIICNMAEIWGTIGASAVLKHRVDIIDTKYSHRFLSMFDPFNGIHGYTFVYFCFGGLANGIKDKIEAISVKKRNIFASLILFVSSVSLFLTGILVSVVRGEFWDTCWEGLDTFYTFVSVCCIFVLSLSYKPTKNGIIKKFILSVSANTLGIYFMHEILIHWTQSAVMSFTFGQTMTGCIIYSFILLIANLLIVLLMKKIPGVKYLVEMVRLKKKDAVKS